MKYAIRLFLLLIMCVNASFAAAQSRRSAKWNTEATDRLFLKFRASSDRLSFISSQGEPVIDYAVYYNVDTATVLPPDRLPRMVRGTNYEIVTQRHLDRMFAEDGELIVPHDRKYFHLLVAENETVPQPAMGKIAVLQAMLDTIASDITFPGTSDLPFLHRLSQMEDFYVICNNTAEKYEGVFTFRAEGTSMELWDPVSGTRYSLENNDVTGRSSAFLTLQPQQQVIVVVRHYGDASDKLAKSERFVYRSPEEIKREEDRQIAVKPVRGKTSDKRHNQQEKKPEKPGKPAASNNIKPENPSPAKNEKPTPVAPKPSSAGPSATPTPAKVVDKGGFPKNWAIEYSVKLMHKPTAATKIQKRAFYIMRPPTLRDWTDNPDTRIKYYSGTAVYRNTFHSSDARQKEGTSGSSYYITMEEAHDSVRVFVNGEEAGLLLHAPFELDITPYVIRGNNAVELHVSNSIVNRMVGDLTLPEDQRVLTSVRPDITLDTPLRPSGIVGVVRVERR